MQLRGHRALVTASTLALALAAGACSAEVDEDGASIEVEDEIGEDG